MISESAVGVKNFSSKQIQEHLRKFITNRGDTTNSEWFALINRDRLLYSSELRTWLVWDGRRWREASDVEALQHAKQAVEALYAEAAGLDNDQERQAVRREAQALESLLPRMEAMIKLARGDLPIDPQDLDRNEYLLNVENGTINLRTRTLGLHSPSDRITKLAPVTFDPDAKCPEWESFIKSILPDTGTREFVQKFLGYSLTGSVREQVLVFFAGDGANGKSTVINAVSEVMGVDYSMEAAHDLVMTDRSDNHPTATADLHGKRLVRLAETGNAKHLNETFIKSVTGGDAIRARRLYRDNFQFNPSHKIVVITNHLPEVRGRDHAIWRRIRVVPFSFQFWNPDNNETGEPHLRQDKRLPEKLRAERSGILNWLLDGCRMWLDAEGLSPSDEMHRAFREYRDEQDILGRFVRERCVLCSQATEKLEKLVTAFNVYAGSGEKLPSRQFSKALQTGFRLEKYTNNGTAFRGIKLRQE